jgi:hypothetical protein
MVAPANPEVARCFTYDPAAPPLAAARRGADGAAHDRSTNGQSRSRARQRLSEAGRQAP